MNVTKLLDDYRHSCNLITERIDLLNQLLHDPMPYPEYRCLNARVNILRTERLELLDIMHSLQVYLREK